MVAHEDEPLSPFTVRVAAHKRHLDHVGDPPLCQAHVTSPQPFVWRLDEVAWQTVIPPSTTAHGGMQR